MGQCLSSICRDEEEDFHRPAKFIPTPVVSGDAQGLVNVNGERLVDSKGRAKAAADPALYQDLFRQHVLAVEERPAGGKLVSKNNEPLVPGNNARKAGSAQLYQNLSYKQEVGLVVEEKWMKHYSNHHMMLLVGEGDFSFSASLATAFGYAPYLIATSLDSEEFLRQNYRKAMANIQNIKSAGGQVRHGVDATEMATHPELEHLKFDRIVYNFPHAGVFLRDGGSRKESLQEHRKLVSMFLGNARKMIAGNGEIHITHKSYGFFRDWNLPALASHYGLQLVEEVHFNFRDYPGYRTKFGFGGNNNFNCKLSKTYKFKKLPDGLV